MLQIYHIQLPISEYYQFATSNLKRSGVSIESIEWISEMDDDVDINEEYHEKKYGFPLSKNETIDFLIHRNLWKKFLESNKTWCMIIENNIHLDISVEKLLNTVSTLDKDCELFFPYDPVEDRKKYVENVKKVKNPNVNEIKDEESYFLGYQWGNFIYFINRKGAEKLLEIKQISQRLDDEILSQALSNKLTIRYSNVEWLDYSQIRTVEFSDRKNLIWQAACNNNIWNPASLKKIRQLLKIMSNTAENLDIDLILQRGSLLGYIRHGGIMPWDDDVDIGIEDIHVHKFLDHLGLVEDICFKDIIERRTGVPYIKIWNKCGEPIKGFDFTFPFIDLWVYAKKGNDLFFKNGIISYNSAAEDFKEILFEGVKFKIPYNAIEDLDSRYKDWKEKIRVFSWSHKYQRTRFYPLLLSIVVDNNGRMISKFDAININNDIAKLE